MKYPPIGKPARGFKGPPGGFRASVKTLGPLLIEKNWMRPHPTVFPDTATGEKLHNKLQTCRLADYGIWKETLANWKETLAISAPSGPRKCL